MCIRDRGYGDTTTDEINAAIQAAPEAFISVGMATTFCTQQLNAAGIELSDIDSFTKSNGEAITNGKLVYLAGKEMCIRDRLSLPQPMQSRNTLMYTRLRWRNRHTLQH